jgi:hypothetical protein
VPTQQVDLLCICGRAARIKGTFERDFGRCIGDSVKRFPAAGPELERCRGKVEHPAPDAVRERDAYRKIKAGKHRPFFSGAEQGFEQQS